MAQQPKRDRQFVRPDVLPKKYEGEMPWEVSCVASVVDEKGALVDGWDVECFLQGVLVSTTQSANGNVSFVLSGTKPGTYRVELRMLDTKGQVVSWTSDLPIKTGPKHERAHQEVHLRVPLAQKVATGYRISATVVDHDGHEIHDQDVHVHVYHPDYPTQHFGFTTSHGNGSTVIPFALNANTWIDVVGANQAYPRSIGTN